LFMSDVTLSPDMAPQPQDAPAGGTISTDAAPGTRPQATRMLAIALARAAGRPELVDRIVREVGDMDPFAREATTPSPKTTPIKTQARAPRASTKISPARRLSRHVEAGTEKRSDQLHQSPEK
jgi:hypothetical protein